MLKKMFNKMKLFIRSLHPSYWIMNYPYNHSYDKWLNKALDDGFVFEICSACSAKLKNEVLWIDNHPYASFTPYNKPKVRPSRMTIIRAHDALVSQWYK